jgi:hypothetical protein
MKHNRLQQKQVRVELAQVERAIRQHEEATLTKEQLRAKAVELRSLLKRGELSPEAKRWLFEQSRVKVWIIDKGTFAIIDVADSKIASRSAR